MATNIFNYNGTLATTIADGSIDNTTSLALPGRGYLNYGEPVNQDMLWIMQNFANSSAPTNPTTGQLWYNTSNQIIYVYNGSNWLASGGAIISSTNPGSGAQIGALWYDSTNLQLNVWNGSTWNLVGPLGSAINTDPINPTIPSFSALTAAILKDTSGNSHSVWEITVGGTLLSILSTTTFTPATPAPAGFSTIIAGLNFSSNVPNVSITSSNIFTGTQSNLPTLNNTYNLGSASFNFAGVYANNFYGQATSALYADVAERYKSDMPLETGMIVSLSGDDEVTATTNIGSDDVFGVVSTSPAYLMNSDAGDDSEYPAIALIGRVPCKVIGPVKKGQRLMASTVIGVACAYDPNNYGVLSILGRALVTKESQGIDTIEVVIGKN